MTEPGNSIAIREIPSLEKFRRSLAELEKGGLTHMLAITDAALAYAKVTKSIEMMNDAVELRLWTERRAGEIVADDDPAETAAELKTHSPVVKRWIFFSSVTEDDFSKSIMLIRQERDLSVTGMFEHIVFWHGKEVSSGIRKLPDGRYRISWKTLEGAKKTRLIDGSFSYARGIRESYVYTEHERRLVRMSKTWKRLDVAYGRIRRLLGELDAMAPSVGKHVRVELEAAVTALHTAEDRISAAMQQAEADALSDKREAEREDILRRAEEAGVGQ